MCADASRLAQLRFGMFGGSRILRIWELVLVWSTIYVCTRESCRSPNCDALEHDRLQQDRPPLPAPASPPPSVLSPSSIPPPSSHCAFIPAWKNSTRISRMSYFIYFFFLNYDVWNRVNWNCLMSWISVSCSFRSNVWTAIDVEFIMQMKSCGNAKCSILEAWKDFCPQQRLPENVDPRHLLRN